MGLGKKMSFSWKQLKWIYSVLEKSSSNINVVFIIIYTCGIPGQKWPAYKY